MPQVAWHAEGRYFSVLECNRHMLENEVACDVTFEVAPPDGEAETVRAHRYVLIACNPVFKAMFCGALAVQGDQITIRDIQPGALRKIIKFLYCESIDITEEDIFDILYAAKKYLVHPVTLKCLDFLSSHVTSETVCAILNYALFYEEEELVKKCMRHIGLRTREVLDSNAFNELSREAARKIVESDILNISESELFDACVGWCKAECSRCDEEYGPECLKRYLGDSFYHFRLLNFPEEFLQSCILGSGMLSTEEEESLQEHLLKHNNVIDPKISSIAKFSLNQRRRVACGEYRCDLATKSSGSVNTYNRPRIHNFSISEDILLHGCDIVDGPRSCITGVHIAVVQDSCTIFQTVIKLTAARRNAVFGASIPLCLPKQIPLRAGDFSIRLHFRSLGGNANVGYCSPPPEGVEVNGVRFQTSCSDVFHIGSLRFSVV